MRTIDYPILIHVGPHKTATTFLQENIFKDDCGFQPVASRREILFELILASPDEFPSGEFISNINSRVEDALERGLVPILSDEFFYSVYEPNQMLRVAIANRLKEIAPNARILMGVREQRSHLMSLYREYIRAGGRASIDMFLLRPDEAVSPIFDLRGLRFDVSLKHYGDLFGEDNVCVLPFELLKADADAYLQNLFDFCGISSDKEVSITQARRGFNMAVLRWQRWFNYLVPEIPLRATSGRMQVIYRIANKLDEWLPRHMDKAFSKPIEQKISESVSGYFSEPNARLSAMRSFPFHDWGYESQSQ